MLLLGHLWLSFTYLWLGFSSGLEATQGPGAPLHVLGHLTGRLGLDLSFQLSVGWMDSPLKSLKCECVFGNAVSECG